MNENAAMRQQQAVLARHGLRIDPTRCVMRMSMEVPLPPDPGDAIAKEGEAVPRSVTIPVGCVLSVVGFSKTLPMQAKLTVPLGDGKTLGLDIAAEVLYIIAAPLVEKANAPSDNPRAAAKVIHL